MITYEDEGKEYTASLDAPFYYKEREGTLKTVQRAWGYACHGDKDMLYSITSIHVEYPGEKKNGKQKNKRISA